LFDGSCYLVKAPIVVAASALEAGAKLSLADVEVAEVLKRPEVAKILILLVLRSIMT